MKYFHLGRHGNLKGWVLWMIGALLGLLDNIITLATLGLIVSGMESHFLFSDLVMDDDRTEDEVRL